MSKITSKERFLSGGYEYSLKAINELTRSLVREKKSFTMKQIDKCLHILYENGHFVFFPLKREK